MTLCGIHAFRLMWFQKYLTQTKIVTKISYRWYCSFCISIFVLLYCLIVLPVCCLFGKIKIDITPNPSQSTHLQLWICVSLYNNAGHMSKVYETGKIPSENAENCRSQQPSVVWRPSPRKLCEYPENCQKLETSAYIFALITWIYLH